MRKIAKTIWKWVILPGIKISSAHRPCKENIVANPKYREFQDPTQWMFSSKLFSFIVSKLGHEEIDFLASRANKKRGNHKYWKPDPSFIATDAYSSVLKNGTNLVSKSKKSFFQPHVPEIT